MRAKKKLELKMKFLFGYNMQNCYLVREGWAFGGVEGG